MEVTTVKQRDEQICQRFDTLGTLDDAREFMRSETDGNPNGQDYEDTLATRSSRALGIAASRARPELKDIIDTVNAPLIGYLQSDDTAYPGNLDTFHDAADQLEEVCAQWEKEEPIQAKPSETPTTPKPKPTKSAAPSPKPSPTPTPEPSPTPSVQPYPDQVVTYILESDGTIEGATFTHMTVGGAVTQEQDTNPTFGKLERTYTFKYGQLHGGQFSVYSLGVGASAGPDATTITCKIVLNGKVVNEQTSNGPYSFVMCNKGG